METTCEGRGRSLARYCANCGHELREGDKFCAECGTSAGGAAAQAQPARRGHWEYHTFTESLNGAKFTGISYPMDGGVASAKSGDIAGTIERVVNALVARLSAEGWEPDESINANTLWREQHVKWEVKGGNFTSLRIILESVSVRFRRWVTQ